MTTIMTIVLLPSFCAAAVILMALVAMSGGDGTSAGTVMAERMQRREDKVQQGLISVSSATTALTTQHPAARDAA